MLLETSYIPLALKFIIPDTKSVYTANYSTDIALHESIHSIIHRAKLERYYTAKRHIFPLVFH